MSRAHKKLLWELGYVAMSPKAIQQRSGVGQGSMYHHFSGKADLAAAAIEKNAVFFMGGVEAHLGSTGSPLDQIRRYMLRSREALKGCQIGKLTQDPEIASTETLRKPIHDAFACLQARLRDVLNEAIQKGELPRGTNSQELAAMLVATIQGPMCWPVRQAHLNRSTRLYGER